MAILVALAVGLVVCYFLAVPFLPALTWALVLTVMFQPLHVGSKNVSLPEPPRGDRGHSPSSSSRSAHLMAERLVTSCKGAQIVEKR